jgi:hypothetical protein
MEWDRSRDIVNERQRRIELNHLIRSLVTVLLVIVHFVLGTKLISTWAIEWFYKKEKTLICNDKIGMSLMKDNNLGPRCALLRCGFAE